ncbi:biliverdin-producing heme oxygenase [Pseudomonas nitroreducens]|uniref:biliverdin-producing heme oxygenase n=1 Tax=Pseudomonas nitroreducens TaxID=46680 RepID=UPI003466F703
MTPQTNDRTGISPALAALRAATHALHADLDSRSPLTAALTRADYLDHAARVLGWMRPLEQALWPLWPDADDAALRRGKSRWLEDDLRAGAHAEEPMADCPWVPKPSCLAEAFGIAYVAEARPLADAYSTSASRPPSIPCRCAGCKATASTRASAGAASSACWPNTSAPPKTSPLRNRRPYRPSRRSATG